MKVLFLDDDEMRHRMVRRFVIGSSNQWTHVYSADEACKVLAAETFDLVFLDHDLAVSHYGAENKLDALDTGQAVVRFIVSLEPTRRPKQVVVHSMNPVGSSHMVAELLDAGLLAHRLTFGTGEFTKLLSRLR